ncbi:MAG: Gfo/Idh/MocA family oxidoreductase [Vallitaleaceae bacterium]|jgi:UDP-N-acetylglucosamine 3-dehydrogenase|nr:Gfo/Idh/MocA family oxidoreductase [Vallitaleaceae bacterium]
MHIGILGTGFGSYHGKIYNMLDQEVEVTIWGRQVQKLEELKSEMGCNITTRLEDILENESIDLVDVCLPSALHREYTIKVLKSGKDALIETPAVLTIEDGEAILDVMKETGQQVYVNMFIRYDQPYIYLHKAHLDQRYGKLKHLSIYRKTPPLWGALGLDSMATSLMIHDLDFITWLLGKPKDMFYKAIESDDHTKAYIDCQLLYDNSLVHLVGHSMAPFGYPFSVGYEAVFDNGMIRYYEDGYEDHQEGALEVFFDGTKETIKLEEVMHCKAVLEQVVLGHKNGDLSRLKLADALVSLELALKMQELI